MGRQYWYFIKNIREKSLPAALRKTNKALSAPSPATSSQHWVPRQGPPSHKARGQLTSELAGRRNPRPEKVAPGYGRLLVSESQSVATRLCPQPVLEPPPSTVIHLHVTPRACL